MKDSPSVVLFDAGGTLVLMHPERTGDALEAAVGARPDPARMTEAHYRTMHEYALLRRAGEQLPWQWWLARYLERTGVPADGDAVAALATPGLWVQAIPGVRAAIEDLVRAGYRVAVLSNSDGSVRRSLDEAGLDGLFEVVVDSHDAGVEKPDPAVFRVALEALGVPASEALYVGDSLYHDVDGARRAGLAGVVLVDPFGLGPPDQASVASVADLPGWLARQRIDGTPGPS